MAEDLNKSEMLLVLPRNLPATKRPSNFYLKKKSTKQDKSSTSPFALEGIFVYLFICTLAEHAGEQFVASDHGGCYMAVHDDCCESDGKAESVAKTVGLKFSLLQSWRQKSATFSQLERRRTRSALKTDRVSVAQNK